MAPDWKRIEEGVATAAGLPLHQRGPWLNDFCGNDEGIRREIESLLKFDSENGFLESPMSDEDVAVILTEQTSEKQFGNYRVIEELGRGGMGAIYLAERTDGEFEKRAALKIIRQTILDADAVNRFRRERQILASLDHPNIARLLDGGVSEVGEPYLVMEYVEGESLLEYARSHSLDVGSRLQLFLGVCSAVSYAHRNLIVHRDIKPANVIVTADGVPKLLDFGLAKMLDPEPDATLTVARALTPAYASPEQLRGGAVSTASDVYSLGVVLYELLTGAHPYGEKGRTSWEEALRQATGAEPARPSAVSSGKAPGISSDIDNITLTALRSEPDRRYASARDLAEDIQRYLDGRPVTARPNTLSYVASKFIRRNRIAVTAAAIVLLAVISALLVSLREARVARDERDRAQAQKARAEHIDQILAAALAYSDPSAAVNGSHNKHDATINEMLDDLAPRLAGEFADDPESRAELDRTVGNAYASQGRLKEAEVYLNSAIQSDIALYGEDSEETALTLTALGDLKANVYGDYKGGEEMMARAADVYRRHPPTEEIHIRAFAAVLSRLGDTRWTRSDYSGADDAYSEAANVATNLTGEARQSYAEARAGLALTRYAQGRLDEAISLFQEAIAEYRQIPNARWRLPDALNGLGQSQAWAGRYDDALASLRESEKTSHEVAGGEDTNYARSLYLQAYALCLSGHYREAPSLIDRSEAAFERLVPDNAVIHANTADARALCLLSVGHTAQAEQFARKAVDLYISQLPAGSPGVTLARIHLADALIGQGKLAEAETTLISAYSDSLAAQGQDHWRTRYAADKLASFYSSRRRDDVAARYR